MELIKKSPYDFHAVKVTQQQIVPPSANNQFYQPEVVLNNHPFSYKLSAKGAGVGLIGVTTEDFYEGLCGATITRQPYVGILDVFRFMDVNRYHIVEGELRYVDSVSYDCNIFFNLPSIGLDEEITEIYTLNEKGEQRLAVEFNFEKSGRLTETLLCTARIFDNVNQTQREANFYSTVTLGMTAIVSVPHLGLYTYETDPALGTITPTPHYNDKIKPTVDNGLFMYSDWQSLKFYSEGIYIPDASYFVYVMLQFDNDLNIVNSVISYDYLDYYNKTGGGMALNKSHVYDFDARTAVVTKAMLLENFLGENTEYEIEGFPKTPILNQPSMTADGFGWLYLWSKADPMLIYAILKDGQGYTKIFLPQELNGKIIVSFIVKANNMLLVYRSGTTYYCMLLYFAVYIDGDTINHDMSLTGFNRLLCYSPRLQKGGVITKVK